MTAPPSSRRGKRPPKPLNSASLRDLALSYVARFSTSTAKLEAYLKRKLRERGWDGEGQPDPAGLAAQFADLGYIDDEAYARMKAGSLLRRGYGARRIEGTLFRDGIDEDGRQRAAPSGSEARQAVLALARKRRFGPFALERGQELPDRPTREKQLAALLRAGHPLDFAREMVNAQTVENAEDWAARCED